MIKLTEKAIEHFKSILSQHQESLGISLSVKKSGCSGNSYVLDLATKESETMTNVKISGINFFIATEDLPMLEGLELDCVTEGLSTHIKYKNPNSTGECGCGDSFSVD